MAIRMQNDEDAITDINITPFVDVVLVLLVIFMVTAHFIVNRGVNLKLPKATNIEKITSQKKLNLSISKNGDLSLNGNLMTLDAIKVTIQNTLQQTPDPVVTLSADKGVIYDSVIHVMDELRSLGLSNFALQLEPESKNE